MKPPSGLARRNGGWALIFGLSSATWAHLDSLGIWSLGNGDCCKDAELGVRGSRPKTVFNCWVAERGG